MAGADFGQRDEGHLQLRLSLPRHRADGGIGAYETQNAFQGRPAQNPDAYPFIWYPTVTYHDMRLDVSPKKVPFKFYVGVDNVFYQLPPYDLLRTEGGGNLYSPVGWSFYAGVTVKF